MSQRFDAIVVGLGGMGSAAAFHLARRGARVLGLEQFDLLHDLGSSHGLSRIIRLSYHEHPDYVPLLRRSYALWGELEREAGERLLIRTGSLEGGLAEGSLFRGALDAVRLHDLPHEVLDGAELRRLFPAYRSFPDEISAVFQPDGGFLLAERCVLAHVRGALLAGADLRFREAVRSWEPMPGGGVQVRTEAGVYTAGRVVFCAGAWMAKLVPQLIGVAVPERQVLAWLLPTRREYYTPACFPVFYLQVPEGSYYGFPEHDVPGFKFGRYHHLNEPVDPDDLDRNVRPADEAVLRSFASRYFPDGNGSTVMLKTCLFTNSPDEHFIVDRHPGCDQLWLAGGFSGHGFKFCSVVGEIMADLAQQGETRHDIGLFRLDRLIAGRGGRHA